MNTTSFVIHALFIGIIFYFAIKAAPFLRSKQEDRILNNKFHFYVSMINITAGGGLFFMDMKFYGAIILVSGLIQAIFSQYLLNKNKKPLI